MSVYLSSASDWFNPSTGWSVQADYTVMFWFYSPSITANRNVCNFGDAQGGSDTDRLVVNYNGGSPTLQLAAGSAGTDDSTTNLVAGQWYHVALVRDGDDLIAYIDGVEECSVTAAVSGRTPDTYRRFGWDGWGDPNDQYYYALKVWERALSAAEIAAEKPYVLPIDRLDIYSNLRLRGATSALRMTDTEGVSWSASGTTEGPDPTNDLVQMWRQRSLNIGVG